MLLWIMAGSSGGDAHDAGGECFVEVEDVLGIRGGHTLGIGSKCSLDVQCLQSRGGQQVVAVVVVGCKNKAAMRTR